MYRMPLLYNCYCTVHYFIVQFVLWDSDNYCDGFWRYLDNLISDRLTELFPMLLSQLKTYSREGGGVKNEVKSKVIGEVRDD